MLLRAGESAGLSDSAPRPRRYVDYLLEAVGKRELFGLLRLEPEKWWHGLLFRDRYNLLGIAAAVPQAVQDSLSQHPGALTQVPTVQLLEVPAPSQGWPQHSLFKLPPLSHRWPRYSLSEMPVADKWSVVEHCLIVFCLTSIHRHQRGVEGRSGRTPSAGSTLAPSHRWPQSGSGLRVLPKAIRGPRLERVSPRLCSTTALQP